MTTAIIRNKFGKPPDVDIKLADLTEDDGKNIGEGLALALITNTSAESAVDEWMNRYLALQELEEEHAWFRLMMNVVAKRMKREAKRKARLKVYGKAGLSMSDTLTDIYMIQFYFSVGEYWFAYAIIGTVAFNMFCQLLIVYGQNRRMGFTRLATDMFTTLIFLKPAVDAYRVGQDEDKDPNLLVDAEVESIYSRLTEVVGESLPALVLQLVALIKAEKIEKMALVSLAISTSTVSFAGTSISCDLDTSPTRRKLNPDFYGYIKNDPTSRIISFLAMFALTLSHVLMKTIATALLFSISGTWAVIYMGCDVLFFMLFKIVRSDFRYWLNLPDPLSLIVSFLMRLCAKVMLDYTLCFQTRHPFEVGGALSAILVVQNQAACFAVAGLYLKYYQETLIETVVDIISNSTNTTDLVGLDNSTNTTSIIDLTSTTVTTLTKTKIEGDMLWPFLIGLFALSVLSAATLGCWIDQKYFHTFTSMETGRQAGAKQYHAAMTDEQRLSAFNQHPSYYYDFKDDLKEFVVDNWAEWMVNRPDWLTDDMIGYIDDEYLPPAEVDRLKEEGGGKRRRSSAFGVEVRGGGKWSILGFEIGDGEGGGSKVVPTNDRVDGLEIR